MTNITRKGCLRCVFMAAALGIGAMGVAAAPASEPQGKTCKAFTSETHAKANAAFWGDVVARKPVTLIGDTNHANTNMYALLADKDVIDAWAAHGVTDVYMEINPVMHERLKPYLQPFDKEGVRKAFEDYFTERGLYTAPGWASLRAHYIADFIERATADHIAYHFISQDDALYEHDAPLMRMYERLTQLEAAYCPSEYDSKKAAIEAYNATLTPEQKNVLRGFGRYIFDMRMRTDADRADYIRAHNGGGREVVLFGSAHFEVLEDTAKRYDNMRTDLGIENSTYVVQSDSDRDYYVKLYMAIHKDYLAPDFFYNFTTGDHRPPAVSAPDLTVKP